MLGSRARAEPRGKAPIDFLLVRSWILPAEVLAHHPDPGIEKVERQQERPRGEGRGHAVIVAWRFTPRVAGDAPRDSLRPQGHPEPDERFACRRLIEQFAEASDAGTPRARSRDEEVEVFVLHRDECQR